MVLSVFFLYILEDPVTAVVVEVDVHIWHVDSVRIEESLKEEVVFYRVYISDFQTVSYC